MTKEQIRKIDELRTAGISCAKIGEIIGVSKDTIKSYCRRHPAAEKGPGRITGVCLNCGAKVVQFPGRKAKKFCSDCCRRTWWNTHLGEVNRKTYHTYTCPQCGKEFESYGSKPRTYCSRKCYAKARQKAV